MEHYTGIEVSSGPLQKPRTHKIEVGQSMSALPLPGVGSINSSIALQCIKFTTLLAVTLTELRTLARLATPDRRDALNAFRSCT